MDHILQSNKLFIIDGGTGTEIERKKGDTKNMESTWSALCSLTDPEILAAVHKDYINAGSDIIIANTYATMNHVLAPAGKADLCAEAIKQAVFIARNAAENSTENFTENHGKKCVVAGSVSTHPPACIKINGVFKGNWCSDEEIVSSTEKSTVELLKSNVDCIFLEMIKEFEHGVPAMKGVKKGWFSVEEKLRKPVFFGTSARVDRETGDLVMWTDGSSSDIKFNVESLDKLLCELDGVDVVGINIMHTHFNVISPAVKVVKDYFLKKGIPGKIGVYPDHGYWKIPQWIFEEIDDETARKYAKEWVDSGVSMIGGCCGTTPKLIKVFDDFRCELEIE